MHELTRMNKYKSKTGIGLISFLITILAGTSIPMIYYKIWIGLTINIIVSIFIVHLFLTTYYIIKNKTLEIKSGFFKESLDIDKIKKISESRNPLSSQANSLNRLEIVYGERKSILISPKDRIGFIENLKAINPNIEIIEKQNSSR